MPRLRFSVLACEGAVLAFGAASAALYCALGIPFRDPLRLYPEKLGGGLMWYSTGLFICLLLVRLKDIRERQAGTASRAESWQRFCRLYLQPASLVHDLRLVNAVALAFVVFIHLKHLTPYISGALFDQQLAAADRLMCGGMLCAERVVQFWGREAAPWMSEAYMFFFPYMGFTLMTLILQRSRAEADRFCFAFAIVWFGGALLIYLLPSWGPCYAFPGLYLDLPYTETAEIRAGLWQFKEHLDAYPKSSSGAFLIAGFPSLHLAVPVLGTFALARVNRGLALLSAVFCAATVVSTLYFGWHYLLDNVGAVMLGVAAFYCSRFSGRDRKYEA